MKSGKLTITEKYAIKGMIAEGKTPEEMSEALGRTIKIISTYISAELLPLCERIAKAQTQLITEKVEQTLSEEQIQTVYRKLIAAGLTDLDAQKVIDKALNDGIVFTDIDHMFSTCIMKMKGGDFMVKRTQGGRGGVAMMTGAASQKMDSSKKIVSAPSSRLKGHIFRPSTKEIL